MKTALGVILLLAALRRASCAVVAVIVMTRHGDRTANYGNPWNFTEAIDVLTPLGSNMSYGNGALIRDMYVNQTSPTAVEGLNATFNPLQIYAQSGDNEVQLNSATAFLQGLFPPDATLSLELTNNITYKPPLSGYQYIPINTVPADSDLFLNGWTDCPNAAAQVKAAQSSPEFAAVQAAHQGYLDSLAKYLGGRPNGLAYAYDMYDLLNYQYTYDRQLFTELSAGGGGPLPLAQLRDLANYEEDTRYDRAAPGGGGSGAGNEARDVAGGTFISAVLQVANATVNSTKNQVKLTYYSGGYQTFLSFWSLANLTAARPELRAITDFGSMHTFEIRSDPVDNYTIRYSYRNGTAVGGGLPAPPTPYALLGQPVDMPLAKFVELMAPLAVPDLGTWCAACGNAASRGCQYLKKLKGDDVSPVAAGFIGAGVTLFVAFLVGAFVLGALLCRKQRHNPAYTPA